MAREPTAHPPPQRRDWRRIKAELDESRRLRRRDGRRRAATGEAAGRLAERARSTSPRTSTDLTEMHPPPCRALRDRPPVRGALRRRAPGSRVRARRDQRERGRAAPRSATGDGARSVSCQLEIRTAGSAPCPSVSSSVDGDATKTSEESPTGAVQPHGDVRRPAGAHGHGPRAIATRARRGSFPWCG